MKVRPSTLFLIASSLAALSIVVLLGFLPIVTRGERQHVTEAKLELVRKLQLTDLCLFPEARYTRHLSQADLHAPFQDHPAALEHFPSGSLVSPPAHLRTPH